MRGRCPAGSWQIPWPPDWNAPCPLQPGPAPEGSWLPHHFSDAGEIIPAGLRVRTPVFHPELNLRSVIRARWSAFVRCYLLLFKMGFTEPSPRGVGLCENRLRPLRAEPVPGLSLLVSDVDLESASTSQAGPHSPTRLLLSFHLSSPAHTLFRANSLPTVLDRSTLISDYTWICANSYFLSS